MSVAHRAKPRPLATWLNTRRGEVILVALVVIAGGIMHAWGMFSYPYLENDEATYVSRAWAFVTEGRLDVYTYRYDHAPVGWMAIGGWLFLTGGDAFFGSMLESGRVFMLVVHLISTVLVYLIAKRFSNGSITAGVIAALIFSASPLGIYFQRRILLDNLMVMWLLLSILLAARKRATLGNYVASGIFFGIAVLTKLNAVFFGPAFLLLLWFGAAAHQRKHAMAHWLAFGGGTVLLFFMYALLNSELFPAPLGADGEPLRVSLIDTFALQLGRGDFAWPWDPAGSFLTALGSWAVKDSFTLALGLVSTVAVAIIAIVQRKKTVYPLALLTFILFYVFFLARGKIVLDLYVTPLLPLLAIAGGVMVGYALKVTPKRVEKVVRPALAVVAVGSLAATYAVLVPNRPYVIDEVGNQNLALDWVTDNVASDAVIATDNYIYPALAQERDYDNTMYFFSAEYDPESQTKYGDDWRNIDYLVLTHEVIAQIYAGTVPKMREILDHSELQASYTEGTTSFLDIPKYISTNGDWVQVYKTKSRNDIVLQDTWDHYRGEFVIDYGQVIDTVNDNTTSTGQADGMTRAIEEDDEATFRGIWQWTQDHLQHRSTDSLISWLWAKDATGTFGVANSDTVCGADQRIIGSLLQAGEKWNDPELTAEATTMAGDWWAACTFVADDGKRYIDSSADGSQDDQLVNPSFFDPTLYRYFETTLPQYPWAEVIDGGYTLLERLIAERGTVPDWAVVSETNELEPATSLIGPGADSLGQDTLRLVPNLLLEEVAGEARSTAILDVLEPQVIAYADAAPGMGASVTSAILSQLRDTGLDGQTIYENDIFGNYDAEAGYWFDGVNFVDQTWAWSWHEFQSQLPEQLQMPLE
ncbi:glycosyl hydrolase family 8 [Marisediminicola senii]|uniref:glycosyl hydrolase family 8 n=1 Tax=Marisediminicola senii TaxID=2711233 RepID=UPI0013EC8B71|nr:glycosyl hydrolase family 8 [Marisediminicola senii]